MSANGYWSNLGKMALAVVITGTCWVCQGAGFQLEDGTYLRDVEFTKVTRRGLVFSHSEGNSVLKPEELPPEERERYAAEIRKYHELVEAYKKKRQAGDVAAARVRKAQAAEAARLKKERQQKFNTAVKAVTKFKGKARYEEALRLLYLYKQSEFGAELNYSALEKIIKDNKKYCLTRQRLKDPRKVAYILILRIYIHKICVEIDKTKDTWLRRDRQIRVRDMRDKLWRLIRSLDPGDLVICARFFNKKSFVGKGTYSISDKVKSPWKFAAGDGLSGSEESVTGYNCDELSDLNEFSKYLVRRTVPKDDKKSDDAPETEESAPEQMDDPKESSPPASRKRKAASKEQTPDENVPADGKEKDGNADKKDDKEKYSFVFLEDEKPSYGKYTARYLKNERDTLIALLKEYYLTFDDVNGAEIDMFDAMKKCHTVFLKKSYKLKLKCAACSGANPRCRTCSGYGIMLWDDYNHKTEK